MVVAAVSRDSPQSMVVLNQRIRPRVAKSPALALELLKAVEWVDVRSQEGIIIGRVPELSFNGSRIQAVIDKIVRGLFFNHMRKRLNSKCVVEDFSLNPPIGEALQGLIATLPLFNIGDGSVFSYSYWFPDPATCESYWFLMFYNDTTLFVAHAAPAATAGK
jgi:hypothetical protein